MSRGLEGVIFLQDNKLLIECTLNATRSHTIPVAFYVCVHLSGKLNLVCHVIYLHGECQLGSLNCMWSSISLYNVVCLCASYSDKATIVCRLMLICDHLDPEFIWLLSDILVSACFCIHRIARRYQV